MRIIMKSSYTFPGSVGRTLKESVATSVLGKVGNSTASCPLILKLTGLGLDLVSKHQTRRTQLHVGDLKIVSCDATPGFIILGCGKKIRSSGEP